MVLASAAVAGIASSGSGGGLLSAVGWGNVWGWRGSQFYVREVESGQGFGDVVGNIRDESVVLVVPCEADAVVFCSCAVNFHVPLDLDCVDKVL